MARAKTNSVKFTGAKAGAILVGHSKNNLGVRIRIKEDQPSGHGGWPTTDFQILSAGSCPHSGIISNIAMQFGGNLTKKGNFSYRGKGGYVSSAATMDYIRAVRPKATHIFNLNMMEIESGSPLKATVKVRRKSKGEVKAKKADTVTAEVANKTDADAEVEARNEAALGQIAELAAEIEQF